MSRLLDNWLSGFLDYTDGLYSPRRFRAWTGMSAVAAALERKAWVHIRDLDLYPNLYLMLVGPPAAGKGLACNAATSVLRRISTIHLAPQNVTTAAFWDVLEDASRVEPKQNAMPYIHHSLVAMVRELGQFIRPGDGDFLNALTDAYDCSDVFDKKRRTTDNNTIQNVCFNLVACCTPRTLAETFTPKVLEQGLPSRFILLYSSREMQEYENVKLFRRGQENIQRRKAKEEMLKTLVHDLEAIHMLSGEFVFDDDAEQALVQWEAAGLLPLPMDTRFEYYCDRRLVHFCKLCMVASAMRSDERIISIDDFVFAKQMLLSAEEYMPAAVEAIGGNTLYTQMQSVVKFVKAYHEKHGKAVPEWTIRQRLHKEVPLNMLDFVIEALIASQEIEPSGSGRLRHFTPGLEKKGGGEA